MEILYIILFVLGFPIIGAILKNQKFTPLNEYREAAKAQFLAHQCNSSDTRYAFKGSEAEIVRENEEMNSDGENRVNNYSLTIFARNVCGEYFMFVSNHNSKPYFKHLSHASAKVVLENDYIAPENSSAA